MASRHLFPCDRCGSSLIVEPSQAGRELPCPSCGQSVTLPTMRRIRELPIAPEESTGRAAAWDPQRQRRLTIGLGTALVGLLFAGTFLYLRTGLQTEVPQLAGKAEMERFADEMPIDELFEAWKEFVRPAELAEQVPEKVVADIKRDRRYLGLAAGGLLLLVAGLAYSGWVAFAPGRATSD